MKRETIKVLGRPVKLVHKQFRKDSKDEAGNYSEHPKPTIMVNTKGFDEHSQARTVIHEYFHAMAWAVTDPDEPMSQETAARLFEQGVADLWLNNHVLLEDLG